MTQTEVRRGFSTFRTPSLMIFLTVRRVGARRRRRRRLRCVLHQRCQPYTPAVFCGIHIALPRVSGCARRSQPALDPGRRPVEPLPQLTHLVHGVSGLSDTIIYRRNYRPATSADAYHASKRSHE
ncbi:hypothetical protein M422DRAFT_777449 [Sphaerobolus stellatus SS14]|nr:hypothetical protein M422DRAFT_777449 [Sphaerobolus stellatus SS14]